MADPELPNPTHDCTPAYTAQDLHETAAELDENPTNGLHIEGTPFALEHLYEYEAGGHHPVQLDDVLDDGRYRVIHKLGSGGNANVWLCRDLAAPTPKYVALKILMAEASTEDCRELLCAEQLKSLMVADETGPICAPLRHFRTDGPNSSHLCFVYSVLGPQVSSGLLNSSKDPEKNLREICHETVTALALLHALGLCHGDFTPANILQHLSGLDGLPEEKVLEALGKPKITEVVDIEDQRHQISTAPPYLVYPISWSSVDKHYFSSRPCVTDFGEAFKCTEPPRELGIPPPYRPPELSLENDRPDLAGFSTDLWALGCTLFEIRTGRKLFSPFDDDDDSYLDAMVEILGIMPEPWWSTTWEGRAQVYADEPDEPGRAVFVKEEEQRDEAKTTYHPAVAQGARSLEEKLAAGVWYMSDDAPEATHREISSVETKLFADLLGQLLRWKPEERVSAEKILSHEWFQFN